MSAPELAASLNPFSHAGWNSGGMLFPTSAFSYSNFGAAAGAPGSASGRGSMRPMTRANWPARA